MSTPTAESKSYVLGHQESELKRLHRQAIFYERLSGQALRLAGIEPGMRVLDAGCGSGELTVDIARLVGPGGEVIAVDRAPEALAAAERLIESSGVANVHLLEGDVATVQVDASVDAIVGRMMLMHVADPVATLRNLASNLNRPGIVLMQEMDIGVVRTEPPVPFVETHIELVRTVFERVGLDTRPGLRLHDQFIKAGLPAPTMVSLGRVEGAPASDSVAALASILDSMLPALEATGLATAAQLDVETLASRASAAVRESGSLVFTPPLIAAWARIE